MSPNAHLDHVRRRIDRLLVGAVLPLGEQVLQFDVRLEWEAERDERNRVAYGLDRELCAAHHENTQETEMR